MEYSSYFNWRHKFNINNWIEFIFKNKFKLDINDINKNNFILKDLEENNYLEFIDVYLNSELSSIKYLIEKTGLNLSKMPIEYKCDLINCLENYDIIVNYKDKIKYFIQYIDYDNFIDHIFSILMYDISSSYRKSTSDHIIYIINCFLEKEYNFNSLDNKDKVEYITDLCTGNNNINTIKYILKIFSPININRENILKNIIINEYYKLYCNLDKNNMFEIITFLLDY